MLNLIVTICNDYKICLHLDATSEGVVLQPDVPPYKQMQLFIGPLYNLMQPVKGSFCNQMYRPTSRCNYLLDLSTIWCNQWWGHAAPQPDATSDGTAPQPKMQPVMRRCNQWWGHTSLRCKQLWGCSTTRCNQWWDCSTASDGAAPQPNATSDGAALHSDATSYGAAPQSDATAALSSDATSDGIALQADATSELLQTTICTVSYYYLHEWC